MHYDKLVRDNIPHIIASKGKKTVTRIASEREYGKKLEEKLQEEVGEFLFAKSEEEMADVLEVLESIATFRNFDMSHVRFIQDQKRQKNGGFSRRIILEEITG